MNISSEVKSPSSFFPLLLSGDNQERGRSRWLSHTVGTTNRMVQIPTDPSPAALSFAQAACCGVPYTTACQGLARADVGKGGKVLVSVKRRASKTALRAYSKAEP